MAHSLIGGSSAPRVLACPGSLALYRKHQPADETSEYAREGSLLHKAAEEVLQHDRDTADLVNNLEHEGVLLTPELVREKLQPALGALDALLATIEAEQGADAEFMSEQAVRFAGVKGLEEGFGSTDVLGRCGMAGIVVDFKFGDGVMVAAKDNAQLKFYAAASMYTPKIGEWLGGLTGFYTAIIQPGRDRDEITSVEWVPIEALLDFVLEYRAAVEKADLPEPPFALGKHCRFCKVKLACPLQAGGLAELALPFDLSPEQLAQRLELANHVEDLIGELRKTAHEYMAAGHQVPGFKLVPKRSVRKWQDAEAAEAFLRKYLKVSQILPRDLVSPAQAEKLLRPKNKELPDELLISVSSGTTIAGVDDPRPAVPNVAAFAALAARVKS